jgi:hypothetical protein
LDGGRCRGWRRDEQVLGFEVAVYEVLLLQELDGTGKLLGKMPHYNLVQATNFRIGVPAEEVGCGRLGGMDLAVLDEVREISKGAELHDEVDEVWRVLAVEEGDDMRMVERLENLDLAVEILLELLIVVELGQDDTLDCRISASFL